MISSLSIYDSEQYLFEIAQSYMRSRIIFTSLELKIFDLLLSYNDGLLCSDIAKHLKLHYIENESRCLQDILDCLTSMNFLERNNENFSYKLTKFTRNFIFSNQKILCNIDQEFYKNMPQLDNSLLNNSSKDSINQLMLLRIKQLVDLTNYSIISIHSIDKHANVIIIWTQDEDDPDNTVSIMLDGIESRLHILTMDIDHIKSGVTSDAYIIVYSITDRQSFQTAVQFIKNIRDNELINNQSPLKRHVPIILVGNKSDLVRKRSVTKELARHAAFKHDCKFIETSAAINDKVDDLLAGTLKQIRINQQIRNEEKRRLTIINGSIDTNDSETPILTNSSYRRSSPITNRSSKNVFMKFLNVFRRKPSKLPADVENLNTGIG
ncbi:unnamed protein product [Rotaria sp. Silwood2]|nr:unnamed protein product [Rotaria sp. Silwood2]